MCTLHQISYSLRSFVWFRPVLQPGSGLIECEPWLWVSLVGTHVGAIGTVRPIFVISHVYRVRWSFHWVILKCECSDFWIGCVENVPGLSFGKAVFLVDGLVLSEVSNVTWKRETELKLLWMVARENVLGLGFRKSVFSVDEWMPSEVSNVTWNRTDRLVHGNFSGWWLCENVPGLGWGKTVFLDDG